MSFLAPAFLGLSLLALPIILLYMLRLRRREVTVSSTMLWQKLLRDREANAPWQKLRRNLLLLLQLLILAAMVFALARPFIPVPTIVSSSVVVLLDGTGSMQAQDAEPSRFDVAKDEINRLINQLSGRNQMTIIQVGQTPTVIAPPTNDKNILRQAVAEAQPETGRGDWQAAFALASGASQGFQNPKIAIISDGGLPDGLPVLPAEVAYIPIGSSGENLAITALATRESETGIELFTSVANNGQLDQEALLSLALDGTLFDSRRISVPAQATANLTWQLPVGTTTIQAQLSEQLEDHLQIDDTAWAVHEGGVRNRALLVTEGNLFLEQLFSVLPGIETFKTTPDAAALTLESDSETFDLYIFDGVSLPDPAPAADLLILNPPVSDDSSLFTVNGVFSDTVAVELADTPLLQFVDWSEVNVRAAKEVVAPWAQTLVRAEGGPLIQVGEQAGYRIALINFDLRDSDLPLQIAFPILMANITGWLNPGRAFDTPTGLQPGDPITIVPGAGTTAVSVQKPDRSPWLSEVGEEPVLFTETGQLGLYQVSQRDAAGERAVGSFAVNLFDRNESTIRPLATLQFGPVAVSAEQSGDVGQWELWPWLAALAFIILLLEWWVHHRGATMPGITRIKEAIRRPN